MLRRAQLAALHLTPRRRTAAAAATVLLAGASFAVVVVSSGSALAGDVGSVDQTYAGGIATAQASGIAVGGTVSGVTTQTVGSTQDAVIAGQTGAPTNQMAIARFLPSGAPDTTFGTNGLARPDPSPSVAYGVATSGANIAAAGDQGSSGSLTPVVAQVTQTGSLSFLTALSLPALALGQFDAVGYDPKAGTGTGDIIAAGTETDVNNTQFPGGELLIAAFTPAGALDVNGFCPTVPTTATFSVGATSIVAASAAGVEVGSAASGTGIAPGSVVTAIAGTTLSLSLATTASGSASAVSFNCPGGRAGEYLDSFSGTGEGGDTVSPGAMAIDSSGNIVLVASTPGFSTLSGSCAPLDTEVVELGPTGAYDTALAGSGHELVGSAPASCTASLVANGVVVNAPGWPAFVIAGAQYPGDVSGSPLSGKGTLLGLTASGAPAVAPAVGTTFGTGGVAVGSSATTLGAASSGGLVVSSGGLLAANAVADVPGGAPALVETGPVANVGGVDTVGTALVSGLDGSLESQFGTNGTATQPDCSTTTSCGQSVAVQSDGSFLVAGGVAGQSQTSTSACTLGPKVTTCPVQGDLSVARITQRSISVAGPGTVSVSGPTSVTFQVTLNGSAGTASVAYTTVPGTATSPTNFSAVSGTVNFPCVASPPVISCVSASVAAVAVPVFMPSGASGTVSFSLVLSSPVNAGLTGLSAPATLDYGFPSPPPPPPSDNSGGGGGGGGGGGSGGSPGMSAPPATAPPRSVTPTTVAKSTKKSPAPKAPAAGKGYWVVSANGAVKALGDAHGYGSLSAKQLAGGTATGIAAFPNGTGYWVVTSKGAVFSFGSAKGHGSVAPKSLSGTVRGIAAQSDGKGYWLVSSTGAVYAFGSAKGYGSVAKGKASGSVLAISRTSSGKGYWLVSSTGAVYAYGNAGKDGQLLGKAHGGSVSGFAALPNSTGYWLATSTGGVYAFGKAPAYGSVTAKMKLQGSVVAITPTPDNKGYWLTSSKGQVLTFGDAHGYGSASTASAAGTATT